MNENQIIEALKKNEKAFCLMDEYLQIWAKDHKEGAQKHYKDMQILYDNGLWSSPMIPVFHGGRTYRLRPDYNAEPDRIEVKIVTKDGLYVLAGTFLKYTDAPAYIPQSGFRFIGFMFAEFKELVNHNMVYWESKQSGWAASNFRSNLKPIHPIAAIYERKVK